MERTKCSGVFGGLAIFTMTLALGVTCTAQEQSQEQSREATPPAPDQQRHKADGERHGLPIETYAVAPGTKFRAKLWLTFDEIHTRFGDLPIVAEVVDVPGDHSVKSGPRQEGLIEGRSSTQQNAAEAAAAGAAIGAVKGVKDKDKKEAAEGAALGALTAYLMESGRGHELNLPKGAKLELELERALYLVKE